MGGIEYRRRSYRERMGSRFTSFVVSFKESDLWVGIDPPSYSTRMEDFVVSRARSYRLELESYIEIRPDFLSSLAPMAADPGAPRIAVAMLAASRAAGVGPMASVAGATAAFIGADLEAEFGCHEIVVENGGDLWLRFEDRMDLSVFAGDSPLSERVGVSIPPAFSPSGYAPPAAPWVPRSASAAPTRRWSRRATRRSRTHGLRESVTRCAIPLISRPPSPWRKAGRESSPSS